MLLLYSSAHLFSSAGADLWHFRTILYLPNSMDGRAVSFSPLAAILNVKTGNKKRQFQRKRWLRGLTVSFYSYHKNKSYHMCIKFMIRLVLRVFLWSYTTSHRKGRCAEQQKSDYTSKTTEKYRKWQGFLLDGQNERFWNSDQGHNPSPPPPPQEDNVDIFVQVQQGLKFNTSDHPNICDG